MSNFNINNWLAQTKEGDLITIDKAVNGIDYYCPECGQILHSRALNSELITPHFYHLNNSKITNCSCEGAYKRYWREYLINVAEIIELKFLNNVTCIHKETNYKVNEDITADIYIKTKEGNNILFLFHKLEGNFINLDYDVFYIDVMNLELNKSNFNDCHYLLHSASINKLNMKLKYSIDNVINTIKNNLNKNIQQLNKNINIDKFKMLQNDLYKANYMNEYNLINSIINSLQERQTTLYKYKNYNTSNEEVQALNKLIAVLQQVTTLNIDLDINILKAINYKIYNKGYYNNSWSKCIYFDIIKPLATNFNTYIKEVENIIK